MFDFHVSDVFPRGDKSEYYIANHPQPEKRIDPGIPEVADFYKFVRRTPGTMLFDCDHNDLDSTLACAALSPINIFVIPVSKHSPALLADKILKMKEFLGEEKTQKIIDKSIVVISGTKPTMGVKNMKALKKIALATAQESGVSTERVFALPYDQSLSDPPLEWNDVPFHIKNIIRTICATFFNDMLGSEDNE